MAVFEIAVVLVLIALNGLFALSELAVVSSRRSRLRALAQEGREVPTARWRSLPIRAASSRPPDRHHGCGAHRRRLLGRNAELPISHVSSSSMACPMRVAEWLAYVGVFSAITYLSLIIGELVPKNLALRNAETIACAVAPLMTTLSRVAAPAVWLLDISTKAVFWLLRQKPQRQSTVTEEEIKMLIAEAERAGVLETGEHRMISGVLRLGDRRVLGLMTPRTEVDWIDLAASPEHIRERILSTRAFACAGGRGLA